MANPIAMPHGGQGLSHKVLNQESRQQRIIGLFGAVVLSLALSACVIYFPWELFSGQGFPDRDNYLASIAGYLGSGALPFDFSDADILPLFLNEYLWREILLLIGTYFDEPANGLLLVSFLAAALTTFHVVRRAGVAYTLVLLLSPLTVDLFISQSRSALALAIVMSALAVRGAVLRYLLFAVSFLVHTFAAVLFSTFMFNRFVLAKDNVGTRAKLVAALFCGLIASAVWAFLGDYILSAIGDRRALQSAMLPSSIPFALWWILLTIILVSFARVKNRAGNSPYVMLAIVLQVMFIFSTFYGAGGLRFLSLSLPFTLIAIRSIRSLVVRMGAVVGTVVFNLIHASYWMS